MVESGELRLLCELQKHDMGDQYTLAYGEEKNQCLYIKYGVKDEDKLLDFFTFDPGIYADIEHAVNGVKFNLEGDRVNISKHEIYRIECNVGDAHKIYQGMFVSCKIVVE